MMQSAESNDYEKTWGQVPDMPATPKPEAIAAPAPGSRDSEAAQFATSYMDLVNPPLTDTAGALAGGEKLAAGDGVSMQTHKAMKDAKVGPYEPAGIPDEVDDIRDGQVKPPAAPISKSADAYNKRNGGKQWDANYNMLKGHMTRDQYTKKYGARPAGD